MTKQLLQTLGLCLGIVFGTLAQDRQITGRVLSGEDNSPLPGVNVAIKNSTKGTQTDAKGNYRISASNSDVLVFSSIGFTKQELKVGNRSTVDVSLESSTAELSEVVVTAFGIKQYRKDISGAMGTVKGKEIENLPVQSFDRALQGRVAGVQITSTSGIPGAAVNVRIRGIGSISAGNGPLYVVDGIQIVSGDFTRSTTSANALGAINPNDIETIDVLKDAAATSIYGAQGANGVVVITTKKGKQGKTQFGFNAYYGYNEVIKNPVLLTGPQWVTLSLEAYANRYGKTSTQYQSFAAQYPTDVNTVPTYNWFDAVSQKGYTHNYEISASGGDARTTFNLSASYLKQDGQVIGTDYARGTARIKFEHKASNKLTFNNLINLASTAQTTNPADGAFANISRTAQLQSPVNKIYNDDGSFNTVLPGAYDNFNPVQVGTYNYRKAVTNQAQANQAITYNFTNDLYFRTNFAVDYLEANENSWADPRFGDGRSTAGSAGAYNTRNINFQTDQTIGYNKEFGKHKVGGVLGFNYKSELYKTTTAVSQGFPTFQFQQVSSGATPISTGGSSSSYRTAGYFFNARDTYNDRYTLEGTIRYDGSSRFGTDNKYGWFPSGAFTWRMKNEAFLKDISWLDDLKFRTSYGSAGNQSIGNFEARALYSKAGDYAGSAGISPNLANSALAWERATTFDVGIDFAVINNRISSTIDFFDRQNTDLLLNKPLPATNGFTAIRQNIGKMQNRGIEFSVSTVNVETGKFRWTTDFNFTYIWNKVTELVDGQQVLAGDQSVRVGQPIGAVFSYLSAGVNPADGRAMWYDTLGNLTYVQRTRDRVVLGYTFVPCYGGLTNTLSLGDLSLEAVFNYQYGNLALNQDRTFFERSGSTVDRNQYARNLDRWQKPGDITGIPKPFFGGTVTGSSSQYALSDRFYEDGSFIRLKRVTLAYRVPKALTQRIKLNSVRVYVQATNLLTWTKYQGIDPEFANGSGDFGQYPQYKNYTAGLQVSF